MRVFSIFFGLYLVFSIAGCGNMSIKESLSGKFIHERTSPSTVYINYKPGPFAVPFGTYGKLIGQWKAEATRLCDSTDYYHDIKTGRANVKGEYALGGSPTVYGTAYCNTQFVDTRKQNDDQQFAQYIAIPHEVFTYQEISPFWHLLSSGDYTALEKETYALYQSYLDGELSEYELSEFLETFSRLHNDSAKRLLGWTEAIPESFLAQYALALYYHNYSWFKRGNSTSDRMTRLQKSEFSKYRAIAQDHARKTIKRNPKFSLATTLEIKTHFGSESAKETITLLFKKALKITPNSLALHSAYLRFLQPRWYGSKSQMREFIDDAITRNPKFGEFESLYIKEEGDQLLFSKKYKKAKTKYLEALNYSSSYASIYLQLGYTQEKLNEYIDAANSYATAVALSPYYENGYENLSRILAKRGDYTGALQANSYLTTINNQTPRYHITRGKLFYWMRRYADAESSYHQAVSLSADNPYYLHLVRMARFQIEVRSDSNNADSLEVFSI